MSAACKHGLRRDLRSALYRWANLVAPSQSSIGITSTSSSFSTRGSLIFSRLRPQPQQYQTRSFSGFPTRASTAFLVKNDECLWVPHRHNLHTTSGTDLPPPPTKRPLIRYTPPGPPPIDQKHQTLTLYTITPIPESQLEDLREELFLELVKFDITGRIYLAKDGINLHVCTPVQHTESLRSSLQTLVLDRFGKGPDGAIWNISCDQPGERVFRKLKVAVKKQLVADGRLDQWAIGDSEAPQYLEPEEFHRRLDQVGDKALLIDMRNHFENEVGTFKTAVKMDCTTFKENMDLLDELLEGRDKSKEVLIVCTGGIRCSVSGRYLRQKGFKDVKMLKGGITSYGRYVKAKPEIKSHFVGKNFTFDGRRGERITEDVISSCHQCNTPHDNITNCANTRCHALFIQCPTCSQKWNNTCGPECHHAVETGCGPAVTKPYDYHTQVRPGSLLITELSKAA
ncbi:hypothetical protein BGZ91_004830 [Linnemannia elongata]|nr:hypothetical protein BGZ91_004830 [Linnemannia elongata]KAG0073603.1 hypothetical protein BGZ90_011449 [Linnemannia elongata]